MSTADLKHRLARATPGQYLQYRVGNRRIICDSQVSPIAVRLLLLGNRHEIYR